jgi:microcystin-dependent protein
MAVRIQFRRGTFAEWDAVKTSVILAAGELGYESTNKLIKFGDGVSTWDTLEVAAAGDIVSVVAGTGLQYGPSTTGYGNAASAGFSGVVELGLDTSVVLTAASIDAKGDLLVGTANNVYTKVSLPASTALDITNGKSLVADSTQSAGVAWTQIVPSGVIQQYAGTTAPAGYLMCDGGTVSYNTYGALATVLGTTYGPITGGGDLYRLPDLKGKVPVGKAASGTFAGLNGQGGAETHTLTSAQIAAHSHGLTWTSSGAGTATASATASTGDFSNNHSHDIIDTHAHGVTNGTTVVRQFGGGNAYLLAGSQGLSVYGPYNTSDLSTPLADPGGTSTANVGHTHSLQGHTHPTPNHVHTVSVDNNTGGGGAHNNLQPYIVLNYIIKT